MPGKTARHGNDPAGSYLPADNARAVLDPRQKAAAAVLFSAAFLLLYHDPYAFLVRLNLVFIVFYLAASVFKLLLVSLGFARGRAPESVPDAATFDWPTYTVLLPVYRETGVLPQLLKAIDNLDYPHDRLDVKLLVESVDRQMLDAVGRLDLPACCEMVVVPDGPPRTKPRACNYGLARARGEFLVIYDAEDVPEPDQLKKSAARFRRLRDRRVVCLQAKLNYYNPRQNLLTRWFTAEYSMWFDLYLPGLDRLGAPIPLGGTSNHFKVEALKAVGGWDPYNVTEDCDLGIRLFRYGYRTEILDSTTWEEANSRPGNWLRQRSRWVKGYIQSWLVHVRRPGLLARQVGPLNFLCLQLTVAGLFVTLLVNPLYWVLTAFWFARHWGAPFASWFPNQGYLAVVTVLLAGNLFFVALNVLGCLRRDMRDLVWAALISPAYWVLMSAGAWRGFYQLFRCPHFWEKTAHGLFPRQADAYRLTRSEQPVYRAEGSGTWEFPGSGRPAEQEQA